MGPSSTPFGVPQSVPPRCSGEAVTIAPSLALRASIGSLPEPGGWHALRYSEGRAWSGHRHSRSCPGLARSPAQAVCESWVGVFTELARGSCDGPFKHALGGHSERVTPQLK